MGGSFTVESTTGVESTIYICRGDGLETGPAVIVVPQTSTDGSPGDPIVLDLEWFLENAFDGNTILGDFTLVWPDPPAPPAAAPEPTERVYKTSLDRCTVYRYSSAGSGGGAGRGRQ